MWWEKLEWACNELVYNFKTKQKLFIYKNKHDNIKLSVKQQLKKTKKSFKKRDFILFFINLFQKKKKKNKIMNTANFVI